ncbi:MAG: single-stranded-DNA-specific exonuclease RecJ [Planctomycetota bacterium]
MLTARMRQRWEPISITSDDPSHDPTRPTLSTTESLLDRLLSLRGVIDAEAADRFLRPRLTHLGDPAALPGCVAAADRLAAAVRDGQPIVIYGDYDVDGVTATAILWHTLRRLGHVEVTSYVPHRLEEGYGLNAEAIRQFAPGSTPGNKPLVVTVDCGITAVEPAAVAKSLGIDLIITDHHEFDSGDLPEAVALVHPGLGDDSEPSPLCGAGVAFKLAWQTARTVLGTDRLPAELQTLMCDLLSFAALGTVADVVPLVGENRVITTHGLSRIKHTPFEGLNALIDAAELRGEKVDAVHVGFVLGPRLNACGRMGHARQAVKLLTDATPAEAAELADFLTKENDRRRATERHIFDEANALVEERNDADEDRRALVVYGPDWHPGVVGIVASRLTETYHRPAVVLGRDPTTGLAKGSARSVEGVDLHAAISSCAHHCTTFGGHAMAAGLSLPPEAIDAFREELIEAVNAVLPAEDLSPVVRYDAEVGLVECNVEVFGQLERLAPFGRSNPRPRLRLNGLRTARPAQRMGNEGKHLSVSLRDEEGLAIRAVGFGLGDLADDLPGGVCVDVVATPKTNTWRGVTSPELHLSALRLV